LIFLVILVVFVVLVVLVILVIIVVLVVLVVFVVLVIIVVLVVLVSLVSFVVLVVLESELRLGERLASIGIEVVEDPVKIFITEAEAKSVDSSLKLLSDELAIIVVKSVEDGIASLSHGEGLALAGDHAHAEQELAAIDGTVVLEGLSGGLVGDLSLVSVELEESVDVLLGFLPLFFVHEAVSSGNILPDLFEDDRATNGGLLLLGDLDGGGDSDQSSVSEFHSSCSFV
jgi:hypothetical protein